MNLARLFCACALGLVRSHVHCELTERVVCLRFLSAPRTAMDAAVDENQPHTRSMTAREEGWWVGVSRWEK